MKLHNMKCTAEFALGRFRENGAVDAATYLSGFDKPCALAALALLMCDPTLSQFDRAAIADAFTVLFLQK